LPTRFLEGAEFGEFFLHALKLVAACEVIESPIDDIVFSHPAAY
jgi:hypothetical protein